jgi:hypothetical protein
MKRPRAPDVEVTPSGRIVRIRSNSDFDRYLQAHSIDKEYLRRAQPILPAIVPDQTPQDKRADKLTEHAWDEIYPVIYERIFKECRNHQTAWRRTLVRLVSNTEIQFPLSFIVKKAAVLLDNKNLMKFMKSIANMKSKDWRKHPLFDPVDSLIHFFWNGFHNIHPNSKYAHMRTFPPLSRWSGPAARTLLAKLLPSQQLGSDGATYRKRLERNFLTIETPVFVRKMTFTETGEERLHYSPEGLDWLERPKKRDGKSAKKCHAT